MDVTDQRTDADVIQPCDNDWHPSCQRCRHCKGCIRGRTSRLRFKRQDTKYCSGVVGQRHVESAISAKKAKPRPPTQETDFQTSIRECASGGVAAFQDIKGEPSCASAPRPFPSGQASAKGRENNRAQNGTIRSQTISLRVASPMALANASQSNGSVRFHLHVLAFKQRQHFRPM
jgi:hypothetical protein